VQICSKVFDGKTWHIYDTTHGLLLYDTDNRVMKLKTRYYTEIIHKVENFKQTNSTRTFAKLKLSYK
jgi:hypothetical protein